MGEVHGVLIQCSKGRKLGNKVNPWREANPIKDDDETRNIIHTCT